MPMAGVLTVVSNDGKELLGLPGLVVAPRPGPGSLADDLGWAEGLRLTSEARTLVNNLAVSRGRGGRLARTLSRSELEDWIVRTSQRRPDGWLLSLRARALEVTGSACRNGARWSKTSSASLLARARRALAPDAARRSRRRA
ncbi:MAG: hypothetical protein ACRD0U_09360 [Acidimicrobiales bacterium]